MGLLLSLTDYKARAGISGTGDDTALTAMLTEASELVRRICDRDLANGFESATRTEFYDGSDGEALVLRENPVTSITSVHTVAADGTETEADADTYTFDARAGILYRQGTQTGRFTGGGWEPSPRWPRGRRNIKVVYVAGGIPAGLAAVVARIVNGEFADRRGGAFKSESIGDYDYVRMTPDERDADIRARLAPYMRGGCV